MTVRKVLPKMPWARRKLRSPFAVGVAFLVVTAIVVVALMFKASISTFLRSGDTITVEFEKNYRLHADETPVKFAGLEVGMVSGIEYTDKGTVLASLKIDAAALESLGPKPSATVSPKTVLGGTYAVELEPGGGRGTFEGESIPRERTRLPVELDRVLEAMPAPTRPSLQSTVKRFDETLSNGGKDGLRDLVADAPETLKPSSEVMEAAQGTRPGVDLPQLVTNLHAIGDVLSRHDGQLDAIVTSLRDTTSVLAEQSEPLADTIDSVPETLRAARTGVVDLRGSMQKLTTTANSFRPAARELGPLLRELDPVLHKARPLMRDLRPLLRDARPLVDDLVPVSQRGTTILNHLRGPVLDRVNGPIKETVMTTWHGTGPYKDSGRGMQADHKFYEELGYLVSNLDRASMHQDAQGSYLGFQGGVNTGTLTGNDLSLKSLVEQLTKNVGGGR